MSDVMGELENVARKKNRPHRRRFVVEDVDIGDGRKRKLILYVGRGVVEIRVKRSRKRVWTMSLRQACETVIGRANRVKAEMLMGIR